MKTIWIFAGGTGGHISPGVSLAETFSNSIYKCNVLFFTLEKDRKYSDFIKLEKDNHIRILSYPSSKIPNSIGSLIEFIKNFIKAKKILNEISKQHPPNAIIGMGGYPVFNGLLWAYQNKIPFFLCEQNSVLGRITKIFAKSAQYVFLSFPITPTKKNYILSGNPIRKALRFDKKDITIKPKTTLFHKGTGSILIIGGSQGAKDLNELYLSMIQDSFFTNIIITISTGKNQYEQIYNNKRKQDTVLSFIDTMKETLLTNDLIISRSGSGLVFEILSLRKPTIFIPFPYAVYDHQKKNAEYLQKNNLSEIIDTRPLNIESAVNSIKEFISSGKIKVIHKNILEHTIPLNAHTTIVETILKSIEKV